MDSNCGELGLRTTLLLKIYFVRYHNFFSFISSASSYTIKVKSWDFPILPKYHISPKGQQ